MATLRRPNLLDVEWRANQLGYAVDRVRRLTMRPATMARQLRRMARLHDLKCAARRAERLLLARMAEVRARTS